MSNATRSNSIISSEVIANTALSQSRWSEIWSMRREASLNWLALGLLLAAWNAAGSDAPNAPIGAATPSRRPEVLRGYSYVSVRAANRVTPETW
ncbi:MAG TPA: hypothetical protein VGD63_13210 [Steroidobacteraceae bacterium]